MRDALIEAMARALCDEEWGKIDAAAYDAGDKDYWDKQAAVALDAALSLLENPSDEMVEAGFAVGAWDPIVGSTGQTAAARGVWSAMLNTIKGKDA